MLKYKTVNILFLALLALTVLYDQAAQVSPWIYGTGAALYFGILAYGSSVLSAQFFVPVKWKGNKNSKAVALTFDDGPIPGNTDEILRILHSYNAPAAFFCIGNKAAKNKALVQSIYDAGHLVCNHSYWHRSTFDLQSSSRISKELSDTDEAIREIIGERPCFFRPPFGVTNPLVAKAIRNGRYITVGWTVRSLDTVIKDRVRLQKRITRNLQGGDVILLHDQSQSTLDILPGLIEHISSIGLKIVRVDELLKENAYI